MALRKLTRKQRAFCDEYLIDKNGAQAAIRAGYSEKTAKAIASENLTKPNVKAFLDEKLSEQSKRTEITADWVLESLKEVVERCMQAEPVMEKDSEGNMVPTGEYKFEHSGANRALELLGKNLKLFTDKFEHSGSIDLTGKTDEELEEIINGKTAT